MQEYDVKTTLLFSKYSTPKFDQRAPKEKLGLLLYLRRINYSIKDDHNE